jgi:hypothetical protein
MFVRFRKSDLRLQVSLLETRRINGTVRSEHVAGLGSVEMPQTVETRLMFWQRLHDRFAKLSNRVDVTMQAKIYGDMRKQISIGIVAAVLSSGIISYCLGEPNQVGYDLREHCGKRAEELWKKGFGINDILEKHDGQIVKNYEYHYNEKLKKCFYLTRSDIVVKKKTTKLERLFDADDNKEYGMFTGGNGGIFAICVMFIGKDKHRCSSEDEWRELVKPYMEDTN